MSSYKGIFTYDIDNHRYIPIEQAIEDVGKDLDLLFGGEE